MAPGTVKRTIEEFSLVPDLDQVWDKISFDPSFWQNGRKNFELFI